MARAGSVETDAPRTRRYEKALEMTWGLTRGKTGPTAQAERDIAAVALGPRLALSFADSAAARYRGRASGRLRRNTGTISR